MHYNFWIFFIVQFESFKTKLTSEIQSEIRIRMYYLFGELIFLVFDSTGFDWKSCKLITEYKFVFVEFSKQLCSQHLHAPTHKHMRAPQIGVNYVRFNRIELNCFFSVQF